MTSAPPETITNQELEAIEAQTKTRPTDMDAYNFSFRATIARLISVIRAERALVARQAQLTADLQAEAIISANMLRGLGERAHRAEARADGLQRAVAAYAEWASHQARAARKENSDGAV